ncbi:MAG: hypothetical protein ISR65_19560 [Bacteriovoracaceae bacterium]|nr:hypothetical protein [Bacteriovoracaceae bacterium]
MIRASKMIVMGLLVLGISGNLFANSEDSAQLKLSGEVPQIVSIEVTATSDATNLDLTSSPTDLEVASVVEKSNAGNGYQVTVSSLGEGNLVT